MLSRFSLGSVLRLEKSLTSTRLRARVLSRLSSPSAVKSVIARRASASLSPLHDTLLVFSLKVCPQNSIVSLAGAATARVLRNVRVSAGIRMNLGVMGASFFGWT